MPEHFVAGCQRQVWYSAGRYPHCVSATRKMAAIQDEAPEMLNSGEELFARLRESKLSQIPSDDKQYDEMLPEHPLSGVRRLLDFCASHIQLSKSLQKRSRY